MAEDQIGTLSSAAGESSHLAQGNAPDISDTIGVKVEGEGEAQEQLTEEEKQAAEAKVAEAKEKEDQDRLDKHPRFKELIEKNQRYERELQELKAKVEGTAAKETEATEEGPKFFDYTPTEGMKTEEVLDQLSSEPLKFLGNFANQIADEVLGAVEKMLDVRDNRRATESSVSKTYESFASEHPDFNSKWDSGEIKRFMASNPGHNAISAYMLMTREDREKEVEAKIRKGMDEERDASEKKKQAELAAKRGATTLRSGAAAGTIRTEKADLVDTKTTGGLVSTIANRLAQMRAASSGG